MLTIPTNTINSSKLLGMNFNTYTLQKMYLPSIKLLHLMVSEIQPGKTFFPAACLKAPRPAHPDTKGENNTSIALNDCRVKLYMSY